MLKHSRQPNVKAGPGFMWKFDREIGRWTQLPIPKWRDDARHVILRKVKRIGLCGTALKSTSSNCNAVLCLRKKARMMLRNFQPARVLCGSFLKRMATGDGIKSECRNPIF